MTGICMVSSDIAGHGLPWLLVRRGHSGLARSRRVNCGIQPQQTGTQWTLLVLIYRVCSRCLRDFLIDWALLAVTNGCMVGGIAGC